MNPFSYGTIVRGSNFYDRKEECTRIVEILSGGNNLVLYAPRRFGKTSLVFKAIEQLEAQGFICIYFDFMPVFSQESFVRLYAKALALKQSNLQKFTQTFAAIIKNIRPLLSFNADGTPEFSIDFAGSTVDETVISQLLDMSEKLAGAANKRVIVFFDEFQEVEKLSGIHFESLLRSKIQQQHATNYLFFGSKTHLLKELFNNKKRAFYNAASQMSIGPLPEKDTIEFLQNKFSNSAITLDVETAQYIISVAASVPHYIQLLAAEIWQYMINSYKTVSKEIVDDCAGRLLSLKGDYYMELFNNQSKSKKQLLQALMVNGENIFSTAYITTHRLPSAATLQRAAKDLVMNGTVEKINNTYFIADPFFKLFLATT
ncbi:ATPase [Bacteroidia bacterium]|nr:ATPase [Bacteroidia bacterium]GHT29188.1 ATPase [Bacteroidia bacterium]GHV70309.1 ATPase [Bacteroidia bacterium]